MTFQVNIPTGYNQQEYSQWAPPSPPPLSAGEGGLSLQPNFKKGGPWHTPMPTMILPGTKYPRLDQVKFEEDSL